MARESNTLFFAFIIIFFFYGFDIFFGLYLGDCLLGCQFLVAGALQLFDLRSVFSAVPF